MSEAGEKLNCVGMRSSWLATAGVKCFSLVNNVIEQARCMNIPHGMGKGV